MCEGYRQTRGLRTRTLATLHHPEESPNATRARQTNRGHRSVRDRTPSGCLSPSRVWIFWMPKEKRIGILTCWPHQESFMEHIIFCVTDRCISKCTVKAATLPPRRSGASNTAIPTVARLQTSFQTLLARSYAANLKARSRIRNGQTELDGASVATSSRCHAVSRQPPSPSICLGSERWHAETRACPMCSLHQMWTPVKL